MNGRAEILQSKVYGDTPDGKRGWEILYFLFTTLIFQYTNNTELREYDVHANSDWTRAHAKKDADINQTLVEDILNLILM